MKNKDEDIELKKKKENEIMLESNKNNDPVGYFVDEALNRLDKHFTRPMNEVKDDIKKIDERLDKVEVGTTIESKEQGEIQRTVGDKIHDLLHGETPKGWKKYSKTFYSRCYSQLKRHFCIPSYRDIRKVDYDEAKDFIRNWEPYGGAQALKDEVDEREDD